MNFLKKIALLMIFVSKLTVLAQTQDLYALASGDYLNFNALFDEEENLYGYVAIFGYGKSNETSKKFEYVVLDKNLNTVANQEFEGDITSNNYFGYINFQKKLILFPQVDYSAVKSKNFYYPRSLEVDLSTNSIHAKNYFEYENGKFIEVSQPKNVKAAVKENKDEKKEKGYNYVSDVYEIKEGGYLVFELNDYGKYTNNNSLMRFDADKKLMWTFKYNEDGTKKKSETMKILEKDEKYIYTIMREEVAKTVNFFLRIIDMKTGLIVTSKPIDANKYELDRITYFYSVGNSIDNDKTFDDKIVLVGRNYENEYQDYGLTRIIIDKNTLDINLKVLKYIDFKNFLPKINALGYVENAYRLVVKDFYFLQDGSVGILMEKFKPATDYTAPKTTDLVYAYTNSNFELIGVNVFDKEKTRWNVNADYLFSQYLNKGKDVVFFYRDLQKDSQTKEKNWNLFINTLIDGTFKQEQVQISEKDNYFVIPYVAKEGYILLREYNEKEKYNKVRLEKLNY